MLQACQLKNNNKTTSPTKSLEASFKLVQQQKKQKGKAQLE